MTTIQSEGSNNFVSFGLTIVKKDASLKDAGEKVVFFSLYCLFLRIVNYLDSDSLVSN